MPVVKENEVVGDEWVLPDELKPAAGYIVGEDLQREYSELGSLFDQLHLKTGSASMKKKDHKWIELPSGSREVLPEAFIDRLLEAEMPIEIEPFRIQVYASKPVVESLYVEEGAVVTKYYWVTLGFGEHEELDHLSASELRFYFRPGDKASDLRIEMSKYDERYHGVREQENERNALKGFNQREFSERITDFNELLDNLVEAIDWPSEPVELRSE